jgi:hypothetical protein
MPPIFIKTLLSKSQSKSIALYKKPYQDHKVQQGLRGHKDHKDQRAFRDLPVPL